MNRATWTKKDFIIDWFSGSGAGGQHRNKNQNCVRVTHIESGLTRSGQSYRERSRNFKEAFNALAVDLKTWYWGDLKKERAPCKELVRTYNICENRVITHSSKHKTDWKSLDLDEHIKKNL